MRKRSHRTLLWSAIGLVVALGVVGGLLIARNADGKGQKKKNAKEDPPAAPVELSEVKRGSLATWLETTTTLEARNSATLVAKAQGEVTSLDAEEGQWVQKGATLAHLDDTAARLAVDRAEVAAEMAGREAERGKQLHGQGYLSDKEIDDLELARRRTAVELAQARHDLSETRIVAPFAGRVSERMIQLGETVTAGRECFRLVDFDPLLARVYFPDREASRLKVGLPATLELDTRPGVSYTARVSLVNPVVDRASGTFKVTLEVRDPTGSLRPGSFARVKLRTGTFDGAIVLPRRAMVSEDGEDRVFVARGDSVVMVPVKLGAVSGDTAQILAGLHEGERVVTVGQGGLKTGSRIKAVRF